MPTVHRQNSTLINIYIKLIMVLLWSHAGPLFADSAILKDGTIRIGKIVSQNRDQIQLRTVKGKLWVIPKELIRRVSYGKVDMKLINAAERRQAALQKQYDARYKSRYLKKQKAESQKTDRIKSNPDRSNAGQTVRLTRYGSIWRSALLPGWGQWQQNRNWAGALYGTLAAGGTVALYESNRVLRNSRRDLGQINNPYTESALLAGALGLRLQPGVKELANPVTAWFYNQPYAAQQKAVDAHYHKVQNIGVGLIAIYFWNIIDAYLFFPAIAEAKQSSFTALTFQFSTLPSGEDDLLSGEHGNFGLAISARF